MTSEILRRTTRPQAYDPSAGGFYTVGVPSRMGSRLKVLLDSDVVLVDGLYELQLVTSFQKALAALCMRSSNQEKVFIKNNRTNAGEPTSCCLGEDRATSSKEICFTKSDTNV